MYVDQIRETQDGLHVPDESILNKRLGKVFDKMITDQIPAIKAAKRVCNGV